MPDFLHANTAALFAYWRSLDGLPPRYSQWDPLCVPALMPFVNILQRDGGGAFVHRFSGTKICEFAGMELTGRPVRDVVQPELVEQVEADLNLILDTPCGFSCRTLTQAASGRRVDAEYVNLPLCGADDKPDRMVMHMAILETLGYGDLHMEVGELLEASWIDIGFGIPAVPPGSGGRDLSPVLADVAENGI
ncbi:MAG: PAS domain-containing protein [Parvibaculaceae bacterium]